MKRFFNTYLQSWYTSDDGLSWYEEKPKGKPSRDRKEARDNKRVSSGVDHRTRKEEHYKYM